MSKVFPLRVLLPALSLSMGVSAVFLRPASADHFALVIGIDDYQVFGKLKTCRNDAKAMAKVLVERAGFPANRVILLTDDSDDANLRPTRGSIRNRVRQVTQLSGPGDTVLIFFSGHGITAEGLGYLVPSDGSQDASDAVALSWVKGQLGTCKAKAKLLILDACHSGSAAKGVSGISPSLAGNDLVMLLSCGEGQFSFPDEGGKSSVFSRQLTDGLSGAADGDGDQTITLQELFTYVKKQMVDWCLKTAKTQTPELHPRELGVMPLAKVVPIPREGYLVVRSDPPGAEVWINGERRGRAGEKLTIPLRDRGAETVSYALKLDRYRTVTGRAEVRRGETTQPAPVRIEKARGLPSGLEDTFEIPTDVKDHHGNLVSRGFHEETGLPLEIRHKATGLHLVFIPAGEFMMGSRLTAKQVVDKYGGKEEYFSAEHPSHRVKLTKPFYLGKYEVTVDEFRSFAKAKDYKTEAETGGGAFVYSDGKWAKKEGTSWQSPGFTQTGAHPVTCVSWNDARAFCSWAGLGVPTEAQWEYACRAGTSTVRYWGDEDKGAAKYANVADESGRRKFSWDPSGIFADEDDGYAETAPVGRFRPNAWGLFDTIGNVLEWCQDWYGSDYYKQSPAADPKGAADGTCRVCRGGSWIYNPRYCRSAHRFRALAWPPVRSLGFRCVLFRDF